MELKRNHKTSLLFLLFFLVVVFISFSTDYVEAKKNHNKKNRVPKHLKQRDANGNTAPDMASQSNIFNVLSFGAKGDGVQDDSEAFLSAWKGACSVPGATLEVPSELKFLIQPITFQGPCMPRLVLQIDGTLFAPLKVDAWPRSSLFQWINFKWVHNFTIQGSGTVDGQGSNWWGASQFDYIQKRSKPIPYLRPTALRFYGCYNVTVRDIRIINSPQCHLKFDNSEGVKVNNITISSPENSPNTDGIHLENTQDVQIQNSNIGCGDDCVSIQTGCHNVHVHHVTCGPGHGISIGGLGKDKSVACVSRILVENISMQNTLYGVRIKTWQGGIGSVKNVSFANIQVTDVKVPIAIDQNYCDKQLGPAHCKKQAGAVAVSNVRYDQINGTYSVQPIQLACSKDIPCTDVDLFNIQLMPSPGHRGFKQALCQNSYGKSQTPLVPSSMDYCLGGHGLVHRIAKLHDNVC